ncbi:alpha-amylase [Corallincola platygyrae]|uniref:Alpha-amylase n=1 Tax=Corallincola platygyrae TaxID=1193278 RepID=A0ABW4XMH9_9GAMM
MHGKHTLNLVAGAVMLASLSGCGSNDVAEHSPGPLNTPIYLYYPGGAGWQMDQKLKHIGDGVYRAEMTLGKGQFQFRIADSGFTCGTNFAAIDSTRLKLNQSTKLNSCNSKQNFQLKVFRSGKYEILLDPAAESIQISLVVPPEEKAAAQTASAPQQCEAWDGGDVTVAVGDTFAEGSLVRDFYSGATATVIGGNVTLTPAQESEGLLLLEPAEKEVSDEFSWDNATVYFVLTDRFENGDPSNDNSYGRQKDGKDEIGTFHGGDLKGLTAKLDYLDELGVNAIWLSAPYEQIHGWVGGGIRGDFKHYAYHGYYVLDYTKVDANMGTEEEFRTFVDEAHKRGIRVVMDIVMNHTGYATLGDMQEFKFGAFQEFEQPLQEIIGVESWNDWEPGPGETYHSFNNLVDYGNPIWTENWWGRDWIRTDIAGHKKPGRNDRTMMLAYLPDFITESTQAVDLPPILANKPDTKAKPIEGSTVRQYLITWLTDWVREYGVDGFRVDTAKHVEMEAWAELKVEATKALAEWKAANPDKAIDDKPFWMTGEVWGHGVNKSNYFTEGGFDSIINFRYQNDGALQGMECFSKSEEVYNNYAAKINSDDSFNVLTYLSSHDTKLFYNRNAKDNVADYKQVAAPFLLLPGGVQIFYGDESARPFGPTGSDKHQGTRSDMNWADIAEGGDAERADLHKHWQKLAQFRRKHNAIAAGQHQKLSESPYAFSRTLGEDKVMVVFGGKPM